MRLELNPAVARPGAPYPRRLARIISASSSRAAWRAISAWPGYAPTPLHSLPGLARHAGVAEVLYKDEGGRFGLGSFKALGAPYAVARLLARALGSRIGRRVRVADLWRGRYAAEAAALTVVSATDGNHGRALAWAAQAFGCRCRIYVHAQVSPARCAAITQLGAELTVVPGTYDDSVRQAAAEAAAHGWFVVSDTAYPGYLETPAWVMQGYTVLAAEALAQAPRPPTHLILQAGVGSFAAAVAAYAWLRAPQDRPKLIVAEPEAAACVLESIAAQRPRAVGGDLDTIMAGLACGEVSLLAWRILQAAADGVVAVPDAAVRDAMRRLGRPTSGDPPIVAGESAAAGVAAMLMLAPDAAARSALELNVDSRVLVIGTELDTDPKSYAAILAAVDAAGPA